MAGIRPKAVVLDFDHTVAHLGHFIRWDDARRELLPWYRKCGFPWSFLESHEGALSLYRDIAASDLLPEQELRETQARASGILQVFEEEAIPTTLVLPAAIGLVEKLARRDVRAAIVTSNSRLVVSAILERDGVADSFETIVGRDDVQQLKPSPEGLLECTRQMALNPGQCIEIGDAVGDIEAAIAAGMRGFGVRGGDSTEAELLQAGAQAVFSDVSGLLTILGQ